MAIYTRTGDKGTTSLFGGKRVSKADKVIEVLGSIDELNSVLGAVLSHIPPNKYVLLRRELEKIQGNLLAIGAEISSPGKGPEDLEKRPAEFEALIDLLTAKLPVLDNFILPGGSKAGSLLHVSRAVARRAERELVRLAGVDKTTLVYFNRLSDLLFTMARYVNRLEKKKEKIWKSTQE